jgi:ketosteroid isomerase-like protein
MAGDHPNAEVARRLWMAVAEGNREVVEELLDENVVWKGIGRNPMTGVFRGRDGVLDYLAAIGEATDEFRSSLDGVYAGDDGAVMVYHVEARRAAKTLAMDYFHLLRIDNGLIVGGTIVPFDQFENDAFWN